MKKSKRMKNALHFWREYWLEIVAVFAVIVGIVLLQFETSYLFTAIDTLKKGFHTLVNFLMRFSLYDLIGVVVVVSGIVIVLWRTRYHLLRSDRWRMRECPRCGSSVHRIHRTVLDRVISFLVLPHGRRFRCDNLECRWTGLRYGRHHTDGVESDLSTGSTKNPS